MKKMILTMMAVMATWLTATAQGVDFLDNKPFKDVLAKAKSEGKLVFVDCYTEWCGPCKMMATREFVKPEAGEYFNKKFVNFKIDMEKGEGPEIGTRYDVNAYPTFLLLDANGDLQGRLVGSAGIEEFIKKVEAALNDEKGLPYYQKRFRNGERSSQFIDEYIQLLNENYMRGELKNVANTILADKTGAEIASDATLFKTFIAGDFLPEDGLFLKVYRERPTVAAKQGEKSAEDLDNLWTRFGMSFMNFEGKKYQSFNQEGFEAYKQKMKDYQVPDVEGKAASILRTNALYGNDYPTLYQYTEPELKLEGDKVNDGSLLHVLDVLVKNYQQNQDAMDNIKQFARKRIPFLQRMNTKSERQFNYKGNRITTTGLNIIQYKNLLEQLGEKYGYTIKGRIDSLPANAVVQLVPIGVLPHQPIAEATADADGQFTLECDICEPALLALQIKDTAYPTYFVADGKNDLTITATARVIDSPQRGRSVTVKDLKVEGCTLTAENARLTPNGYRTTKEDYEKLVADHKDSFWAPILMLQTKMPSMITKQEFGQLSEAAQQTLNGRLIRAYLYPDTIALGERIWPFYLKDNEGKEHDIMSLVKPAKVTLIDFWASWCKPCRMEMQNVKKYYARWHKDGFNVISISVDRSRDAWLKATQEEQMAWANESNYLDEGGRVADLYMIPFVPKLYLVDSEGRLLGEDIREEALKQKLEELMGTPFEGSK